MSKLPKNTKKIDKILNSATTSASSTPTRSRSPSDISDEPAAKKKPPAKTPDKEEKKVFPLFQPGKSEKTEPTTSKSCELINEIKKKREELYESVDEFRFNKKRVRVISEASNFPDDAEAILYCMSREQRVQG